MTKPKKNSKSKPRPTEKELLVDGLLCMVNVLAMHRPVLDTPMWRHADKIARAALRKAGVKA